MLARDDDPQIEFRLGRNYGVFAAAPYRDSPTAIKDLSDEQVKGYWKQVIDLFPELADHK